MMNKAMKYKLKLDYTADELKELKELGKNYWSPMKTVWQIVRAGDCNGPFKNLREKYFEIKPEDEFDFMADINNVVMGTAIFPEKKYIVHDKVTDQCIYYNWSFTERGLRWGQLKKEVPEMKTKDEWLAINSAYEPMLEKVED